MNESKQIEWLLECLIHVIGRVAIKLGEVREVVGDGQKQIRAYNLCDGSLGLNAIAKRVGLDQGNLSRSVDRWVKAGLVFRFQEGNETRLLHIYPIPEGTSGPRKVRGRRKKQ